VGAMLNSPRRALRLPPCRGHDASMPQKRPKGVFCLEGDWWNDLNRSSTVKPVLKLAGQGEHPVPYVHRDVATEEELTHYLKVWTQKRYARFPMLYLAFHGEAGAIFLGSGGVRAPTLDLDWFSERLHGKCKGRIIHFGSCETLSVDARHVKRFLRETEAVAVTGYREPVDWLKSAAFELLLFNAIQKKTFTKRGAQAISDIMDREVRALVKETGFRMITL